MILPWSVFPFRGLLRQWSFLHVYLVSDTNHGMKRWSQLIAGRWFICMAAMQGDYLSYCSFDQCHSLSGEAESTFGGWWLESIHTHLLFFLPKFCHSPKLSSKPDFITICILFIVHVLHFNIYSIMPFNCKRNFLQASSSLVSLPAQKFR